MNLEIPMVSVIGLGHIGLPVFDELIKRHVIDRVPSAPAIGSDIVGVDISPDARDRAMQIINSKYDLGESCRVRVTGTLENSSVYIIAIYSPEGIMEMLTKIIPEINDGAALVIIESTFEPEYLCDEKYGHDFMKWWKETHSNIKLVAYPHRLVPYAMSDFGAFDMVRVMGASDEDAFNEARNLYYFVNDEDIHQTTFNAAVMAKACENAIRFIEIAFAKHFFVMVENYKYEIRNGK